MKVALYGQGYSRETEAALNDMLEVLQTYAAEVIIEEDFRRYFSKTMKSFDVFNQQYGLDASCDLFVSFGGDGTVLRAITYVRDMGIPVVGVNTGRLGFLSTIRTDQVQQLVRDFFAGAYHLVDRCLVAVDLDRPASEDFMNFALNEVTVSRKDTTSMITVETYLDNEYLTSYWADGLIVATPTGSTGYSLSCGGPVITPSAQSLVLTPIAPHNLNARPMVISDTTVIKLKVSGREPQHLLSLDSRITSLDNGTEITITKADFSVKMVEFPSESFFKTIRHKLLWGEDRRN
ncbi:NAD kinase [Robiginitalea sp.]|nr:NAD kinase [Robiginitalea sp.]